MRPYKARRLNVTLVFIGALLVGFAGGGCIALVLGMFQ